jgi:hypothetical protein
MLLLSRNFLGGFFLLSFFPCHPFFLSSFSQQPHAPQGSSHVSSRGVLVQPPHRLRHGKPRKRRSSQAASQRRRTKCSEDGSGRRLGHDDRPESLAGGLRRGSGLAGSWARRGESAARRWPSYEECDAERAGGGGGRRWGRSNGRGGVYGRTRNAHRNEWGPGGRKKAAAVTL